MRHPLDGTDLCRHRQGVRGARLGSPNRLWADGDGAGGLPQVRSADRRHVGRMASSVVDAAFRLAWYGSLLLFCHKEIPEMGGSLATGCRVASQYSRVLSQFPVALPVDQATSGDGGSVDIARLLGVYWALQPFPVDWLYALADGMSPVSREGGVSQELAF